MERVTFITTETGDDLMLCFAVQHPDDPTEIQSLIFTRTPETEFIFEEEERGVKVSFERDEDEDQCDTLEKFDYAKSAGLVRIKTNFVEYELDVSKVDPDELKDMHKILKKMNFDGKFQVSGI
jgi:hypothetical protein